MAQNGFGVYVGLHVRKDSAAIAAFNREVEQAVANAGKIDIGKALSAASVDTLTLGNDIQKKLDKFNFRIRIQRFDADGAIANLRRQIESMIGGINVNAVGKGGGGGSDAGNASSEASLTRQRNLLTDIVRLRTQAESALNRNILGDTGSTGVRLNEIITDLQTLQGQVSTTAEMSESEIANINSLFAELRLRLAGVSEDIVVSGENGDAAAQSYNRYLNLLNQIATKRRQINSILNSNTNITGTPLDAELRASLATLDRLEIQIQKMPYITRTAKEQFSVQINEVRNDVSRIQSDMVRTGQTGNTMFTRLINGFKKFGGWTIVTRALTSVIRLGRQLITNVKEIDTAMTQLKIVTKATGAEINSFGNNIANAAKQTGSSMTSLIDSATTYARLGYSLNESSDLAKYTSMLQTVGAIDVSDAQDAITAITKAFNIDVSQLESVMDKLVEVGNGFPISVSQIAEGLNNASSALAGAGNTFEQSVALLTAANTTVDFCRAA